jgi:hypothetical protein
MYVREGVAAEVLASALVRLTRRLFRYPLSYLVYSDSFSALPAPAKGQFYSRLLEVLRGEDQNRDFAHLSTADRQAILEILEDTKPDFTAFVGTQRRGY